MALPKKGFSFFFTFLTLVALDFLLDIGGEQGMKGDGMHGVANGPGTVNGAGRVEKGPWRCIKEAGIEPGGGCMKISPFNCKGPFKVISSGFLAFFLLSFFWAGSTLRTCRELSAYFLGEHGFPDVGVHG